MSPRRRRPPLIAAALLLPLLGVTPSAGVAQEREYRIQGTILDADTGEPLSDVSVQVNGTRFGALSGAEGLYDVRARLEPGAYTLEYALIGRRTATRQVTLAGETAVTVDPVSLAVSAVALEDLVVTGVGVRAERRTLGNTVESISGEEVANSPGATAVDVALQGKITGAVISENSGQPGGGTSVRLRGTSTILGNAEPLYVIDGVIVDNSSEALVSLGANAGRGEAALTNRVADLVPGEIERIEVLKGAAAAGLYGSRANSGVIQIFTKQGRAGAPRVTFRSEVSMSETPARYELNMAPTAGTGDVVFGGGAASAVGEPVQRFDLQDQIFRRGVGTTQELSVSGGSAETSYYVSGNYTFQEGIIRATDYERTGVRGKITQSLFDGRLEFTANAGYTDSRTSFVPEGEQVQGALTVIIFTPTVFDYSFDEELGRFPTTPILGANPLDVMENWEAPENVSRFLAGLQTSLEPVDGLTFRYQLGFDDYRQENRYFIPPLSTSASFTGSVQNPVRLSRRLNHDLTAEYATEVSDHLVLTTTAGGSYTADRSEVIRAAAQDLPPGQTLVGGATQFASQGINEIRTMGGFIQEQVALNDRLFVTGGLNAEASSAFGNDERWQLFPRVGASWLVHEEPFWDPDGPLSTLRLRAAYGETGGQPPGAFSRFENYIDVTHAGRAGLVASVVSGNPELRPERQREIEGGLDLGLFDDRAVVELTYYRQRTTDLVLPVPLPPSSGAQSQLQNIGELRNRGFEAALTTVNLRREDVSWTSRLQLSANRNRVERLVTSSDTLSAVGGGYPNFIIEDQPLGVFFGGFYARDAQGNIMYDEDGLPLRATNAAGGFASKIIGDPNPDLVASLSNTIDIGRDLQVSFLLDGRFGNDVANFTRRITEFFGVDRVVEREISGDTVPGTYTLNPNGRIGIYEEYMEDGSFVKLREAAVGYRIERPFGQRIGVETMEIRLAGRNLFTITDYTGLDPEINLFSANPVARGVDFATTPVPRSFHASVTLRL